MARIDREIARRQRQLEGLSRRVEREGAREAEGERRARSLLQELDRLGTRLALREGQIRIYNLRLRKLRRELRGLKGREGRLARALEARREQLGRRLRALYMEPAPLRAGLLVGARSMREFWERLHYLRRIAAVDAEAIRSFRERARSLGRLRRSVRARRRQLARLRALARRERREVAAIWNEKERLLEGIRAQKARRDQLMRELEEARRELVRMLNRLARERQGALKGLAPFISKRGKLPWPVEGRVIPNGRGQKAQRDITLRAPRGAPVRPVDGGEVVFANWLRGYGNLVIVHHGEQYYSISAHAADLLVEKGMRVGPRQVIARVGDAGSIQGAILYFEIRHGAEAQDPFSWLAARPR
ncbi:MAG: murein hydrolase activator EnvC family protein [Nitrospinota bacterium]